MSCPLVVRVRAVISSVTTAGVTQLNLRTKISVRSATLGRVGIMSYKV